MAVTASEKKLGESFGGLIFQTLAGDVWSLEVTGQDQYKEKVGSLKRDTELPIACPLMAIDDHHNPIYWGPHSLLNSQRDRKYKGSLSRFLTD